MLAPNQVSTLIAVALLGGSAAADPPRLGPEFQVSTYTAGTQARSDVAVDDDGDFVVVWLSDPAGLADFDVKGRRFDADGVPQGTEFRVRKLAAHLDEEYPAVAMHGEGAFVVVWQSDGDRDGDSYAILGQRFGSSGDRLGNEFIVNTATEDDQRRPAVAMDAEGRFFVVWEDRNRGGSFPGLAGRLFEADGDPLGPDFQISAHSSGQSWASVTANSAGDFLVAWSSNQDGTGSGIFSRRFGSAGQAIGGEFQVNSYTPDSQIIPTVRAAPGGDFRVVWTSRHQDGDSYGVFARHLDSTGSPQGTEVQVNNYTTSTQLFGTLAIDRSGDFVVVWQSYSQDGSFTGIVARRFAADGTPEATEFVVNTFTSLPQTWPAVAMDRNGNMVVTWTSSHFVLRSEGQDGDGPGIFAQRFGDLIQLDVDRDGAFEALTDALLLLRYEFGFRGTALVVGAVDLANCTRCDAPAIEAFIAGAGVAIDVDGNGEVEPLTDGVLAMRWAFGVRGDALTAGAVGSGCDRCDASEVDGHLTLVAD